MNPNWSTIWPILNLYQSSGYLIVWKVSVWWNLWLFKSYFLLKLYNIKFDFFIFLHFFLFFSYTYISCINTLEYIQHFLGHCKAKKVQLFLHLHSRCVPKKHVNEERIFHKRIEIPGDKQLQTFIHVKCLYNRT